MPPAGFQEHRYSRNLSHQVDFRWPRKRNRGLLRSRVRLNQEAVACQSTPSANTALTVLQEINWPIIFISPAGGGDFSAGFINYYQGAGL